MPIIHPQGSHWRRQRQLLFPTGAARRYENTFSRSTIHNPSGTTNKNYKLLNGLHNIHVCNSVIRLIN